MKKEQVQIGNTLKCDPDIANPRPGEIKMELSTEAALTPEQKQQILHERARVLATETASGNTQEETIRIVEFSLAHERYAVEAIFVRGVHQVRHITPIPCTPSFILGIINVHGRILSVVDLRSFFDLPQVAATPKETVVVLRTEKLELGVAVDTVLGSQLLPLKLLKTTSLGRSRVRREYLRGVVEEQMFVLDVERILSDRRMIVGGDEVEL